ncbi:MAG: glutathione S-transferase C-terminal domain-containing protein [Pseudomonadota bacterium]
MGVLEGGVWRTDDDVAQTPADGRWRRAPSQFRNWITTDGASGPTGRGGFPMQAGRYHLYAAWNCPWAHRALLARAVLGLTDAIGVSFVAPRRTDQGWVFRPEDGPGGEFRDALFGAAALHEVYVRSDPDYSGRVTVPLLWDRETGTAVSNESADIVRMLGATAHVVNAEAPDLYPAAHRAEIDAWNARIHARLNNGVYRTGFATTQAAYDEAVAEVFDMLDALEAALDGRTFLVGDQFTEADLRLIPTLVRFDVAYVQAFKCTRNRLSDMPNLWAYARRLYHRPGVADAVRFDIYRQGYNSPSPKRNPHGIVPAAPAIDWRL